MSRNFPFERFLKPNFEPNSQNEPEKKKRSPFENHIIATGLPKRESSEKQSAGFSEEEIAAINDGIFDILRNSISPQKFSAFFEKTFTLSKIGNDVVHFDVTTQFIKTMIDNHYTSSIKDALLHVLGNDYEVMINVSASKASLSSNSKSILKTITENEKPKTARDAKFSLNITPTKDELITKVESKYIDHVQDSDNKHSGIIVDKNKSFDNFVIGPSNNMAYATAQAVAKTPGKSGKYPSLYIYSDSGLGKTHLLHAVANEITNLYPDLTVYLVTAREFMNEMVFAIQNNNLNNFRKKYSDKLDVLMIDDIHELKGKQGTQNEFFHIFNELHNKGKQLLFTSDKAPKEIDGIEERIKTRLQWGLVIDIQRPDLETRIAILKKKALELDLYLADDIISLIASSVKSSIRELEGSLIKLSAFAEIMNMEIDLEMVRELLHLDKNAEVKKLTIEGIAKSVSHYFKIPLADLKAKARSKDIARARHIAMYLSHAVAKATLLDIGKYYGGRDHTSVLHGVNKIKKQMKEDTTLSRDIIYLENNL